jgi:signal transduction histidine kinase
MFFVGVPLAFALLHLLLFFFYPLVRANLYFAVFTGSAAAVTYAMGQTRFVSSTDQFLVYYWLFKFTLLILFVSGGLFLYVIFYPRLPRLFWGILAVGSILGILSWYVPEPFFYIFGMVVMVEMLRVVLSAIIKKKDGAWIIGIGFLIFCLATGYQALTGLQVLEVTGGLYQFIYAYGLLGLLVSMSVYLARNFSRINLNLEAQLGQVKELSTHLESANVELEEYSQTLEKKVEERTHEVRAKNEELEGTLNELRKTQAQLIQSEKMASLGNLVAGVSHELNTPVGALNSMQNTLFRSVERLKETMNKDFPGELKENNELQEMIRVITDANRVIGSGTERVVDIVKSLRNFARLDEAEYQVANIHDGIDSTLTLLQTRIGEDIAIIREYGEISPIFCSPSQLNQVFMHLLQNAAQSIEGKGEVRIKTYQDEDIVHIHISDTGIGIPPDELKRIFDVEFSRTSTRVKMEFGFSTVYNIIQDHKGEIKIESEVGKGTEVKISLPLRQSESG